MVCTQYVLAAPGWHGACFPLLEEHPRLCFFRSVKTHLLVDPCIAPHGSATEGTENHLGRNTTYTMVEAHQGRKAPCFERRSSKGISRNMTE
jgi:hypothetical protein